MRQKRIVSSKTKGLRTALLFFCCTFKMVHYTSIIALAILIVSLEDRVEAGCGWFCGGSWYTSYTSPNPVITKNVMKTATASNGGCSYPDEPSPTGKCETESGTTSVVQWEISGSLTYNICSEAGITVGANYGQSITYTYRANSGHTITGFCQTCSAETGLKYSTTNYSVSCSCTSGTVKNGSIKKFEGEYTNSTTGIQPNPPCNPTCPPKT